ncbi:MAG: GxxExxY protein [Proteobacteria bacterium]|nr:GxxExxY protein [Pseudomonadota bacterium]MCH8226949.1 GxxExxY protein [Pseudomonadota bacterium]
MNLSGQVIGCAIEVHRALGTGFLESVYDNALAIELARNNIDYKRQFQIAVTYKNRPVGRFVADYLVDNMLILELKAIDKLNSNAQAQVLNYLKATGLQVGLIFNFGRTKLEIKRLVLNLEIEKSI